MENTAFEDNQINPEQQINNLPTQENLALANQIPPSLNPIILNPGVEDHATVRSNKRSFLGTLGMLFAGWLVGNLIILVAVGIFALGVVGSTGLIQVPILTSLFFGNTKPTYTPTDQFAFVEASDKLDQISDLKKGEKLNTLELSESEINALINNRINTIADFPIGNQKLKFENNRFVFSGNLLETNAPIEIHGKVEVANLTAKVSIDQAKFGKINLPIFIANSIMENSFNQVGLSVTAASIPAKSLKIAVGRIVLSDVVNPSK